MWVVNWKEMEKHTGWAMSKFDDGATAMWDTGAKGWDLRTEFEHDFTLAQVGAMKRITKEDTVLDACCGAGRVTIPLSRIAKHVTGLDAGENMLKFAKAYADREGCSNIDFIRRDWHKTEPGVDYDKKDIVVACICPAQADIMKLSKAAKKYCYSLSFTGPAYRGCMAELFEGCGVNRFAGPATDRGPAKGKRPPMPPREEQMDSCLNIPFNILYDHGALPEISYVDGGWSKTAPTFDAVIDYLCTLSDAPMDSEQRKQMEENAAKRIVQLADGSYKYHYPTSMYVLGWDPNQLTRNPY